MFTAHVFMGSFRNTRYLEGPRVLHAFIDDMERCGYDVEGFRVVRLPRSRDIRVIVYGVDAWAAMIKAGY